MNHTMLASFQLVCIVNNNLLFAKGKVNIHELEVNNYCFIIYKSQGKCQIYPRKIEKDKNVPPFLPETKNI